MGDKGQLPPGWRIRLNRKKRDAWDAYRRLNGMSDDKEDISKDEKEQPRSAAGAELCAPEKGRAGAEPDAPTPLPPMPPPPPPPPMPMNAPAVEPAKAPVAETTGAEKGAPGKARIISSSWERPKSKKEKKE